MVALGVIQQLGDATCLSALLDAAVADDDVQAHGQQRGDIDEGKDIDIESGKKQGKQDQQDKYGC